VTAGAVKARAVTAGAVTGARRALALVAVALLAALALVAPAARAEKAVPFLAGRVVDEAGMLSAAARQRIETRLADVEKQTGDQVAVLVVGSLDGEPLEDYTVKVAQTWKLGQKGKDNGVLLFIARDDRKMRIEVGYGLEPKLTDLQSHQILDEVVRPRFQQGDFDGGVEQGVDAIAKLLSGEALPPRPAAPSATAMPLAQRAVGGLIFLLVVGIFSTAAVGIRGCVSWFLYAFLAPFYFVFPLAFAGPTVALVAVLAWLVGFPVLKFLAEKRGWRGWSGRGGGGWGGFGGFGGFGGWSSGGGGGGGFSGGGGGFSGGGGSFGGGGASGGW
jgi:uncharacterized protein